MQLKACSSLLNASIVKVWTQFKIKTGSQRYNNCRQYLNQSSLQKTTSIAILKLIVKSEKCVASDVKNLGNSRFSELKAFHFLSPLSRQILIREKFGNFTRREKRKKDFSDWCEKKDHSHGGGSRVRIPHLTPWVLGKRGGIGLTRGEIL